MTQPDRTRHALVVRVVDKLTDEHKGAAWVDRDGDVWAYSVSDDDWRVWSPGNWESSYASTNWLESSGPFTEIKRVDR